MYRIITSLYYPSVVGISGSLRCWGATAPVAPPYVATSVAAAPQRAHRPSTDRWGPPSTPAGTFAAQRPRIGGGVRPSPLDRLTPAYGRRQPPPYVGHAHACIVSPCWPPGGLPAGGASASRQREQIPRKGVFCIKKRSVPDSIACVTRCSGRVPHGSLLASKIVVRWCTLGNFCCCWLTPLLPARMNIVLSTAESENQRSCMAVDPSQQPAAAIGHARERAT